MATVSPLDLGPKLLIAYYRLFRIVFAVFRFSLDIFLILLRRFLSLIAGWLNLLYTGAHLILQSDKVDSNLVKHALNGAGVNDLAGLDPVLPRETVVPMDVLQELLDIPVLEHFLPEEKLVLVFEYQISGGHFLVD